MDTQIHVKRLPSCCNSVISYQLSKKPTGYLVIFCYHNHIFYKNVEFPNCLCSSSTRKLELLLWGAGPTAQHSQDCPIFFKKLNYVHRSKQNTVWAPYVKLPYHKVAPGIPLPLMSEAMLGKHGEEGACSLEQWFQLSSANTTQTIREIFAWYWGVVAWQPNIWKT